MLLAAAIAVMLLAYANSIGAPFLLDNAEMIRDTRIQSATSEHIHRIWTGRYWEGLGADLYRPLATFSYLYNFAVLGNGTNPAGYHWFNLAVLALNMVLVYWLGRAIFAQPWAALLLAAVWGLHPVQTESVTNVIGRSDMMAACGTLAALLAYRKASAATATGGTRAAWLGITALATAAGMLSKESAVMTIALLVLWDLAFEPGTAWRTRLAGYAAVVVPTAGALLLRANVLGKLPSIPVLFTDNPIVGADFWTGRLTAMKVIGKYITLLVWPASLSFDYSFNQIPLFAWNYGWEDWKAILSLAGCVLAGVGAIVFRKRNRAVFFFVGLFFAALAPVANLAIPIGTIMGERLLYLPSIGFAGCVVCAVVLVARRLPADSPQLRKAGMALGIAVALAFVVRIHLRNQDWTDAGRLYTSAASAVPGSHKAVLAAAVYRTPENGGQLDRAVAEVGRALSVLDVLPEARGSADAYRHAGAMYRLAGERVSSGQAGPATLQEGAQHWYRKSLAALLRAEKIELAQEKAAQALNAKRGMPGLTFAWATTYHQLGLTYMRLGSPREAVTAMERGAELGLDADLLVNLAEVYRMSNQPHPAAKALVEALVADPRRTTLMPRIVELYGKVDPGGCAVTRANGANNLNIECPLVRNDICGASAHAFGIYKKRGQLAEAEGIRKGAVEGLGCPADAIR
jgi:protein O-mannosyl-transferase